MHRLENVPGALVDLLDELRAIRHHHEERKARTAGRCVVLFLIADISVGLVLVARSYFWK